MMWGEGKGARRGQRGKEKKCGKIENGFREMEIGEGPRLEIDLSLT